MKQQYKISAIISNPNTPKGKSSDLPIKLTAEFTKHENTYGNGTYLTITDWHDDIHHFDIRYDMHYNPYRQEVYLVDWVNNYWSGKNGAYYVKKITVERM